MSSLALLAKQAGFEVSGFDTNFLPPMSDMLKAHAIPTSQEPPKDLSAFDIVVVGNGCARHHPIAEVALRSAPCLLSAPQFLHSHIFNGRHVIAVTGTHGKSTTTTLLTWILQYANMNPSYLIGGISANSGVSAALTSSPYFVIEADEYDSAFFDKRSKFLHYFPKTLLINHIEFDHADIFDSLDDIHQSFANLVKTIPSNANLIVHETCANAPFLTHAHAPITQLGSQDQASFSHAPLNPSYDSFEVRFQGKSVGAVNWGLKGRYNADNAIAAIAAATAIGVPIGTAIDAVHHFKGLKRRFEFIGTVNGARLYDDFAHHPTSIAAVLETARNSYPDKRIMPIIDPQNYSMRTGQHAFALAEIFKTHPYPVILRAPVQPQEWITDLVSLDTNACMLHTADQPIQTTLDTLDISSNDVLIMMSSRLMQDMHALALSPSEMKS